ncbi:MAG: GGDEF domain-containing protein [Lachnospiraceae bacterium]
MMEDKRVIAVCIAKIGDYGCYDYIEALNSCFIRAGYRMMVYHTCSDFYWNTPNEEGERAVFELIDYKITDAVVIIASSFKSRKPVEEIIRRAKENGKPVICIDGCFEDSILVLPDYKSCFEKIVRHVVEYHGVRDVGFISGLKGNEFAEDRLSVYKKVLEENGIAFEEDKVAYGDFWSGPAKAAVQKMIRENKVPKALICANDVMAIAACAELQENGYRVPEDILVTGFDGFIEGRYFSPNITSCDSNYGKIGECVTEILKNIFEGKQTEAIYRVGFELLISQSCGCTKGHSIYGGREMIELNDRLNHYRTMDRDFYEISAEILTCDNVDKISAVLRRYMPSNVTCLINKAFFEMDSKLSVKEENSSFDEEMCILYDSRSRKEEATVLGNGILPTYDIRQGRLVPDQYELLESDIPMVFTAVCFWNRAIGYVCTYFPLNQNEYLSISQCAIGISNALGGFRNTQYQSYLFGQIEKTYTHDALTGLLNRHGFYKYSASLLEEMCKEKNGSVLMLSADLDGLKHINDCFGHLEGDNAIYIAAQAIKEAYPEEKICFRFGGDEILCLIPVYEETDMEKRVRKSIEGFLENYNKSSGKPYAVSLSLGFSMEQIDDFSMERIIKKADMRMYSEKNAKKKSRN